MTFDRYIEVGRVAYIAWGPDKGKLLTILDVLDQNRALVDGPAIARTQMNFKSIHLTKLKVPVARGARHGTVLKAWKKARIDKKWKETSWYKRLEASETRANMGDFDRFKLMKAKQSRNRLINLEVGKLRKAYQSRTIKIGRPKAKRIEGIKKPKAKRVRDKKGEDKKGEDKKREGKKREDKKGEDKKREGKKREDKKGEDKKREGKKGEDKKRDGKKREGKKREDKKGERSVVWRTQVRKIKTVAKRKRDLAKKAKKRAQKKDAKK